MKNKFAIGIDYGTNSVRAILINTANGRNIASAVFNYRRGENGILLDKVDPNVARQSPLDYIEGFEYVVAKLLKQAKKIKNFSQAKIIGIGIDTTGSTPIPVTKELVPLALVPEFKNNLNAQAWLWKDHSSLEEAQKITRIAECIRPQYLRKCGGTYSSEWFFSKIWHCLNIDKRVFNAAYSWVELADFMPAYICGITDVTKIKRCICAAGHKAMYNNEWKGLPDKEFLSKLHPQMADLRARLYEKAYASNTKAGDLSEEYTKKFGLSSRIPVAVGAFDAHMGAVGAGIGRNTLVKIIGTSSCDIMVSHKGQRIDDIPGVCGIVGGSVLPDCMGIEAGQSAVGDILNWFVTKMCEEDSKYHDKLTRQGSRAKPGQSGLLALDWNNGNRTILVDAELTGLLIGQTLQTTRWEIYRALIEATAFGALRIIERIEEYGLRISKVINCGGIASKNHMFMQIYADVIGKPMLIAKSQETCALGGTIFGAVIGGAYSKVENAQKNMCSAKKKIYSPDKKNHLIYKKLYKLYKDLYDSFGTKEYKENLYHVMKKLLEIKENV
ncbi:ribulokinase [bacterium]|nr:ribulokinase [bacterium]